MVLHVRGIVLPEREERSLWIDGGVLVGAAVQEATASGRAAAARPGCRAGLHRGTAAAGGLTEGAPADMIAFSEDPVAHPDVLHHPARIILRGQILA